MRKLDPEPVGIEEGQWHARYSILRKNGKKVWRKRYRTWQRPRNESLVFVTRNDYNGTESTTIPVHQACGLKPHWNAVKTKKNQYTPCSVTVTTLHRQLVNHWRARTYVLGKCAHVPALLETRKNRAKNSDRIERMRTSSASIFNCKQMLLDVKLAKCHCAMQRSFYKIIHCIVNESTIADLIYI